MIPPEERAVLEALETLHAALRRLPPDSYLRADNDVWAKAVDLFADALRWRSLVRPGSIRRHKAPYRNGR